MDAFEPNYRSLRGETLHTEICYVVARWTVETLLQSVRRVGRNREALARTTKWLGFSAWLLSKFCVGFEILLTTGTDFRRPDRNSARKQ